MSSSVRPRLRASTAAGVHCVTDSLGCSLTQVTKVWDNIRANKRPRTG